MGSRHLWRGQGVQPQPSEAQAQDGGAAKPQR